MNQWNKGDWGPEIIIEEEAESYEQIIKNIHSRIVSALNHDSENGHICDNVE